MLCNICKLNESSISVQQKMSGGTVRHMYICESCAASLGLKAFSKDIDISITNMTKNNTCFKKETYDSGLVCPECGRRLTDIQLNRQLGCPNCFFYFRNEIIQILEKYKQNLVYTGSLPKTVPEGFSDMLTIEELKQRLNAAVDIENYELAVFFRDKIKELEEKNAVQS